MSRTGTNKKTWVLVWVWAAMLLAAPLLASAQLAQPQPWTAKSIEVILTNIANFLIAVGIIGAVITLVTAGIFFFASGFSTNAVTKAKGLFRGALIGTLLIVGAGVIINTIGVIITGEFFGVVGPSGTGGGGQIGDSCEVGSCGEGLLCSQTRDKKVTICVRKQGGLAGEPCIDKSDCAGDLICDQKLINAVPKTGTCTKPKPVPKPLP